MDREKVIKGLEICLADEYCNGCPYEEDCFDPDIDNPWGSGVMRDALALLKEQEAVVPYQHDAVWLCGNCENEEIGWDDPITCDEIRYPFCRKCGRPVKWK